MTIVAGKYEMLRAQVRTAHGSLEVAIESTATCDGCGQEIAHGYHGIFSWEGERTNLVHARGC